LLYLYSNDSQRQSSTQKLEGKGWTKPTGLLDLWFYIIFGTFLYKLLNNYIKATYHKFFLKIFLSFKRSLGYYIFKNRYLDIQPQIIMVDKILMDVSSDFFYFKPTALKHIF